MKFQTPILLVALSVITNGPSAVGAFLGPSPTVTYQQRTSQSGAVSNSNSNHKVAASINPLTTAKKHNIAPLFSSLESSSPAESSSSYDESCDVIVLGGGPAGRAIATLLSTKLNVILADANYDREFPPNYGVWEDEWRVICDAYKKDFGIDTLQDDTCIDRKWDITDCYFGGSFGIPTKQRTRLDRPYYRVDKNGLQKALSPSAEGGDEGAKYRVLRANHMSEAQSVNLYSPFGSLIHDDDGSTILLKTKEQDEIQVRSKLIVDCTGHETKLVLKEGRDGSPPPGFQIAYGVLVTVDESDVVDTTQVGPYDKEAMTLFDYRTDHYGADEDADNNAELKKVKGAPTFMYAMPLKDNQIFFEETSLVARPAVSFQECKDRCFKRLEHLGIKTVDVLEEEFCYIPMGGALPAKDQRVVGFGGASAMVHPSTGYNLCRNMMGATAVANSIINDLSSSSSVNMDKAAASAYNAMWSPSNIRQRNFAVFGGDYLMKQNVEGLRGFFDGFFKLPLEMWGGFLAGWPGLPNNDKHETWVARLWFGLTFVSKLPLQVATDMFLSIVSYSITDGVALPQSVTPLFGDPASYEYVERPKNQGDIAAKNEARKMIEESKLEVDLPVPFEADAGEKEAVASM